ncbi:MAG: IS66 family transposase [Proteobacteria bacterium]|nr:IS66 family transposase [Pseudomonadota bacterium]
MHSEVTQRPVSATQVEALTPSQMAKMLDDQSIEITQLRRQVAWFQRQIFGQKSERRIDLPAGLQGTLGQDFSAIPETPLPGKKSRVAGHEREAKPKHARDGGGDESQLFFDDKKVPVEIITVPNPETEGLAAEDFEVIGEKVSYRLAQRPGSYVVLKYLRSVIKRRDTQILSCPPAPVGVIEGSRADVSFVAGMMVDKFAFHLPLYRQHQRLRDAGIQVSRSWLTHLMQQTVGLLEPIHDAQVESIRAGRVIAMDETPIKAGPTGAGKMKAAYFWPVYGEQDEISFLYYPSRAGRHVQEALGLNPAQGAVLLTDGYGAYKQYAKKTGLTHAQCWTHTRRKFDQAQDVEPTRVAEALDMIGALYAVEARIRDQGLTGEAKRAVRLAEAKAVVERFFAWVNKMFEGQGFLPSSPLTTALAYALERREALEVYLSDPDVQIDTNHLERALRAIPMGRKNWMFTWTELGAMHVGIVQSLLVTCRLHDIDPYDYFVDVLQRVGQHPASRVEQLTPRRWKELFADKPLRSDLYDLASQRNHAAG